MKFMLHISKDEQRQRLQERLDDPTKHWKFDMGDIQVREQWDAYQRAYEAFCPPRTPRGRRGPSCPPTPRRTAI